MLEHAIAYIDEAGSLPDPNDRYVIFAAIVTTDPRTLRKVVKKVGRKQKKVQLKRLKTQEAKWWKSPDGTRQRVLTALALREVRIYWLAVDKEGKAVQDTPENYGLMLSELVRECLAYYPDLALMTDVHFSNPAQRETFNQIVLSRTKLTRQPTHLESQQDSIIQLADFVAGAVRQQFTGTKKWAELIEGKVVVGKVVKWRELAKTK